MFPSKHININNKKVTGRFDVKKKNYCKEIKKKKKRKSDNVMHKLTFTSDDYIYLFEK